MAAESAFGRLFYCFISTHEDAVAEVQGRDEGGP